MLYQLIAALICIFSSQTCSFYTGPYFVNVYYVFCIREIPSQITAKSIKNPNTILRLEHRKMSIKIGVPDGILSHEHVAAS
jgi:hypothetical protein